MYDLRRVDIAYVVERLAINHDPGNVLVRRHKRISLFPILERKLDGASKENGDTVVSNISYKMYVNDTAQRRSNGPSGRAHCCSTP
jgi:hypothetical protein